VNRLTARHRLLLGGLTLAAGVWAVDYFTAGGPKPAGAAESNVTEPTLPVVDWVTVDERVRSLIDDRYESVQQSLDELDRDLFKPTGVVEEAFAQAALDHEQTLEAEAEDVAKDVPPPPTFDEVHQLTGVMLGRRPIAAIDGRTLRRNSELDGHVLIAIARDHVVFRSKESGEEIRLELQSRIEAVSNPTDSTPTTDGLSGNVTTP